MRSKQLLGDGGVFAGYLGTASIFGASTVDFSTGHPALETSGHWSSRSQPAPQHNRDTAEHLHCTRQQHTLAQLETQHTIVLYVVLQRRSSGQADTSRN